MSIMKRIESLNLVMLLACVAPLCSGVALGGVRTNDYSWVRGTHYRLNGNAEKTARELGYGRRVGLNAVRFWVAQGDWRRSPRAAAEKYRAFVRQAWECGYYSMPILFNGNGLDPAMLEGSKWQECSAYVSDIVNALREEPGLLMWDVMNEPTYNAWIGKAPDAAEKRRREEKTFGFIRRACSLVKRLDPASPVTLGCSNAQEAECTADCVDVLSFHDYSSTREDVEKGYAKMDALGRRTGKPVIQSETGCTAYGNGYDMAFEACARHRFGWFFFNLIIHGYTEAFHGVFYADGTVRDPSAISAMMGCYRCRDLDTIIPASPTKPGKEIRLDAVIEDLRKAIAGGNGNAHARTRLFLEMERAANYLESCELVAMNVPPTARIFAWRKMDNPPMDEVTGLAGALLGKLQSSRKPRPCRKVEFKPLDGGTMLYGDPVRNLDGKPFAKDPSVIRHNGRYLMYYSACRKHESTRQGDVPGTRVGKWCCAVAESTDLVNWRRVGDVVVEGAPFQDGWIAPGVRKIDGKIHLFAQSPVPGAVMPNQFMNQAIWHATSDDGIRFKFAAGNPVFTSKGVWNTGRAIDAEIWKAGDKLILAYASRDKATGRRQVIGLASAPLGSDYGGDKWTELSLHEPLLSPDRPWEMNCVEAATVVKHKGIWYMFYAGAFNHERQQIGLAWSEDGVHFKRWRDTPVLTHGPEGSWNAWESGHPGVFQDDDGQIYLFFQGKATLRGCYRLSCLKVEFMD